MELYNSGNEVVTLSGWYLDDKSDSGVKSSALKLEGAINPGEYKTIMVPSGKFVLNNTGGDSVVLYYADKTIANKVSYADDAKEGLSYQQVNAQWLWSTPTLGLPNSVQATTDLDYQLLLNEVFPNPEGSDEGKEWVELNNHSVAAVSLKGFIVDVFASSTEPSSGAWVLDSNFIIPAKSLLKISIPEDKFNLGNASGGVRLFSPSKKLLDSVQYVNAPEGRSYSKNAKGGWEFTLPTPNQENVTKVDYHIIISELLPNPAADEDEFVELFNQDNATVTLKSFKIGVGTKTKIISDIDIAPHSFAVLLEDDLPAKLRNTGGTITCIDSIGNEISAVIYPKAVKGQSYGYVDSLHAYAWTEEPTPGGENVMVLGASTIQDDEADGAVSEGVKPVKKKAAATVSYARIYDEMKKANKDLEAEVATLQSEVHALAEKLSQQATPLVAEAAAETGVTSTESEKLEAPRQHKSPIIIGIIAAALLGILLLYKNPFK